MLYYTFNKLHITSVWSDYTYQAVNFGTFMMYNSQEKLSFCKQCSIIVCPTLQETCSTMWKEKICTKENNNRVATGYPHNEWNKITYLFATNINIHLSVSKTYWMLHSALPLYFPLTKEFLGPHMTISVLLLLHTFSMQPCNYHNFMT